MGPAAAAEAAAGTSGDPAPAPDPGAAAASAACVDLLSQMQFELNRMSELFLSTVGELQRDAGPVPVNAEDLVHAGASTSYDAEARSSGFATELMQAYKNLQLLISKLPVSPGTEQEQCERIQSLQEASQQLTGELETEQRTAEAKLQHVQELYAMLAKHELAHCMAMS